MTHKEIEKYLLTMPNTWLDFPFGEGTSVYKVGDKEKAKANCLLSSLTTVSR